MRVDPDSTVLPKRIEIAAEKGQPEGAKWIWGDADELGRLNMLTSARTAAAAQLIRTGQVVNLNLRYDLPNPPVFGREPFKHKIKMLAGGQGNDDLYDFNTQSGSQWDGFRHVATRHNDQWIFYNGITQHDIENTAKMGMEPWAKHGIVGRGVLIDVWRHLGESYDAFTTRPITLREIMNCAKSEGVTFQYGDILIVRSGWVATYLGMDQATRDAFGSVINFAHNFVGVEQTEEVLDFLHDHYFSAVAGDAPGFEAWPPPKHLNLHEHLLPLWAVPIGEMWDLEELSEVCHSRKQFTFFLASTPANVAGGVGSLSNAMAIF